MKRNLKYTVLALAAIFSVVAVSAKSLDDIDLGKAQEKAKNILDQVAPKNPSIQDKRANVELPDVTSRVPVMPSAKDQGQVAPTKDLVDPFAVAERAKKMYNNPIDPSMLEGTNLVVFVSFSMPDASLRRVAAEVAKVNGMMVIRGFVNDSLKETVEASQNYTNLGAQIQIHPDLFREFNVTQVPSYVLVKAGTPMEGCSNLNVACQNYVKVEGDASLHAVLERMEKSKNSGLSASAGAILQKLEGQ